MSKKVYHSWQERLFYFPAFLNKRCLTSLLRTIREFLAVVRRFAVRQTIIQTMRDVTPGPSRCKRSVSLMLEMEFRNRKLQVVAFSVSLFSRPSLFPVSRKPTTTESGFSCKAEGLTFTITGGEMALKFLDMSSILIEAEDTTKNSSGLLWWCSCFFDSSRCFA